MCYVLCIQNKTNLLSNLIIKSCLRIVIEQKLMAISGFTYERGLAYLIINGAIFDQKI